MRFGIKLCTSVIHLIQGCAVAVRARMQCSTDSHAVVLQEPHLPALLLDASSSCHSSATMQRSRYGLTASAGTHGIGCAQPSLLGTEKCRVGLLAGPSQAEW